MQLPERGRRLALNVLLFAGSMVVAGVGAELAVRVIAPQVTMFPRYVESRDYPIAFPANAQLVHSRGRQWRYEYTTNELGRRGAYVPFAESYATTNVVVLGDSFTFGIGVHDDSVYTERMADELGDGYAVVNGGMSGFGLDAEMKWFYEFGVRYQPAAVVLQFTANDPSDDDGVTSVADGALVFHDFTGSRPAWQLFVSGSGLIQRSHLYSLARGAYDRRQVTGLPPADPEAVARVIAAQEERYIELLEAFAADLEERGIALFFLSVTALREGDAVESYDVSHFFPTIFAAVERLGEEGLLRFVELPLERMAREQGSPEGHQWGAQHHAIVGSVVADQIRTVLEGTD